MASISPLEKLNWESWKRRMTEACREIFEEGPPRISTLIRKGIKDLREMDIVLKQADKNLGIVAIRRDIYNHMLNTHLNSKSFTEVPYFPHEQIIHRMQNILKLRKENWKFEGWIKYAQDSQDPCPFYIVPKLHKQTIGSRPITAQHSYLLAPLSQELAKVLQQEVDKIPEVPQDSRTVVKQREELVIKEPFVLVTYDVEKMYPSIDLRDAIKTLYDNLIILRRDNGFWVKVLKLIMYNNYVSANGKTYRQMIGTATGTQVAPPFANLYMYFKYRPVLRNTNVIFTSRYIDDGFLIIKNRPAAEHILTELNDATNLDLTYNIDNDKAVYLDLEIFKGRRYRSESRLDLKVYFKPTNKLLYLPAKSHHPQAHKLGIIKGEAIRCMRNCSDKVEWLKAMHVIFKGLLARGYSPNAISSQWKLIRYEDREKYIEGLRENDIITNTRVMTKYHPQILQHWNRLIKRFPLKKRLHINNRSRFNKRQQAILKDWPPQIVFKDFQKLGKALIHAKQNTADEPVKPAPNPTQEH